MVNYIPSDIPGMGERLHIIGDFKNPIYVCQKKDIPGLFTFEFWQYYKIWEMFHFGFGLPDGRPWGEQNPDLMEVLLNMERIFSQEFSQGSTSIKYLESVIRHQRAAMGVKN